MPIAHVSHYHVGPKPHESIRYHKLLPTLQIASEILQGIAALND